MTTAIIKSSITNYDRDDWAAVMLVVERENARRAALPIPLPALPLTTALERRTSYQTVMDAQLMRLHLANVASAATNNTTVKQIREAAMVATDAQRAAALTALTT